MNRDIQVLRAVIEKLTPMLAGMGLRVTQRGAQAFVKYKKDGSVDYVNIPHIPDNAEPDLVLAIQGFIDHEVGHILFSDFTVLVECNKMGAELAKSRKWDAKTGTLRLHQLDNLVEDPYVEREMAKKFPGALWNLDKLYHVFLEKMTKPALDKCTSKEDEFGILMVPAVRAWAGQRVFQEFLDKGGYWDQPLLKAFVDRVPPALRDRCGSAKDSWEVLDVALELFEILYPPPPPSPPEPPPAPPSGAPGEDGKGEKGKGRKSEKKPEATDKKDDTDEHEDAADPKSSDAGDVGEADADDGVGEDTADEPLPSSEADPKKPKKDPKESGENDAGDDAEGDKPDDGDDGAADDDADDGSKGSKSDAEGSKPSAEGGSAEGDPSDLESEGAEGKSETGDATGEPSAAEPSKGEATEKPLELPPEPSPFADFDTDLTDKDLSKAVAAAITEAATEDFRDAPWCVFSTEYDVIEPLKVDKDYEPRWLTDLDEKTRHMVAPMQKDIERMMAARSQVIQVPGFRSGRLHGGSLHKLRTGDDRVFRRRQESLSKETAVELVIDNSGSMHGSKMQTAMAAGYALSQTLERVGIAHEVIGFTTCGYEGSSRSALAEYAEKLREEMARIGRSFSRTEPIYMPIYKAWEERLTPAAKARFASAYGHPRFVSQNIDGECVRLAGVRLARRTEPRKVMLVLSDGAPACSTASSSDLNADLRRTVKDLTAQKIEVIGIGIQDANVKKYYPKAIVLENLEALPKTIMNELRRILLAK